MKAENEDPIDSANGVIVHLTSRYKSILRLHFLIGGVVFILILGTLLFFGLFRWFWPASEITVNDSGGIEFHFSVFHDHKTIQWLYAADGVWRDSDIEIRKGDSIEVFASGRVNMAIHHLVKSAQTDLPPFLHWSSPEGLTEDQEQYLRGTDWSRLSARISPNLKIKPGALLMQIAEDRYRVKDHPHDSDLYVIGSKYQGRARRSGKLYFTINEVLLDSAAESTYFIDSTEDLAYVELHSYRDQKASWDSIKKYKYWNLWFDDNVGYFLITCKVL
jgi:hypothetical protein